MGFITLIIRWWSTPLQHIAINEFFRETRWLLQRWKNKYEPHPHLTILTFQTDRPEDNNAIESVLDTAKNLWNCEPCCNLLQTSVGELLTDYTLHANNRQRSMYATIENYQEMTMYEHFTNLLELVCDQWEILNDCTNGDDTTLIQICSEHVSLCFRGYIDYIIPDNVKLIFLLVISTGTARNYVSDTRSFRSRRADARVVHGAADGGRASTEIPHRVLDGVDFGRMYIDDCAVFGFKGTQNETNTRKQHAGQRKQYTDGATSAQPLAVAVA